MNTHTFVKRISNISKIVKKDGNLSAYGCERMRDMVSLQAGEAIHPKRWNRSQGHYGLQGVNKYNDIIEVLKAAGIEYTTGNDAPKGGLEGDFIRLTEKGMRQVKDIDFKAIR